MTKYIDTIPATYKLHVCGTHDDKTIYIHLVRDGHGTVYDATANVNDSFKNFGRKILGDVKNYATKHYERCDAHDRRKTGGKIDVARAVDETAKDATYHLDSFVCRAADRLGITKREVVKMEAWRVINVGRTW